MSSIPQYTEVVKWGGNWEGSDGEALEKDTIPTDHARVTILRHAESCANAAYQGLQGRSAEMRFPVFYTDHEGNQRGMSTWYQSGKLTSDLITDLNQSSPLIDIGRRECQLKRKAVLDTLGTDFDAVITSEYVRSKDTASELAGLGHQQHEYGSSNFSDPNGITHIVLEALNETGSEGEGSTPEQFAALTAAINTLVSDGRRNILVIGHQRSLPNIFQSSHAKSRFLDEDGKEDEDGKFGFPLEIDFLSGVTYGGPVV